MLKTVKNNIKIILSITNKCYRLITMGKVLKPTDLFKTDMLKSTKNQLISKTMKQATCFIKNKD